MPRVTIDLLVWHAGGPWDILCFLQTYISIRCRRKALSFCIVNRCPDHPFLLRSCSISFFNFCQHHLLLGHSTRHIIDYRKKQTRTLHISENKFYKRWRHEIRHKGPPVKISPPPYPSNRLWLEPTVLKMNNIFYKCNCIRLLCSYFVMTRLPVYFINIAMFSN